MEEPHPSRSDDAGVTAEFARADLVAAAPPAAPAPRSSHLPGLETDRTIDDWGRSERVQAAVEGTVERWLYNLWFRVETSGIEHVPSDGGALLLANRAGALPADAAMILAALRREHPARRAARLATSPGFKAVPVLGMVATKVGAVGDHPADLLRLLLDERELVLAFPEQRRAPRKPLTDRYRVRPFDERALTAAVRARVPIVPVAVLGAGEASPVLASLRRLPITPPVPLPAKFRLRFLEPFDTASVAPGDGAAVRALAREVRAQIGSALLELVVERRSVWLG